METERKAGKGPDQQYGANNSENPGGRRGVWGVGHGGAAGGAGDSTLCGAERQADWRSALHSQHCPDPHHRSPHPVRQSSPAGETFCRAGQGHSARSRSAHGARWTGGSPHWHRVPCQGPHPEEAALQNATKTDHCKCTQKTLRGV